MTKLVCAECRHENEAERIYCHNCGERLDRSAVSAQKKAQDPQEVHRRLQKMLGPPNMARAQFLHRQQIGFGCSSRSRAGGNRAAAGIAGSDQGRAAASGSRFGERSLLSEDWRPRIFAGPNQRLSRLSIDQ
jgi:hypothetical protein